MVEPPRPARVKYGMNIVSDPKSIPRGSLLSPEANAAAAFAAATATATGVLTVDLDAIVANWRKLEKSAVPAECAAVIKADAYGCGVDPVARALAPPAARRSSSPPSMKRAPRAPPCRRRRSTCSTASSRIAATPTPRSTPGP